MDLFARQIGSCALLESMVAPCDHGHTYYRAATAGVADCRCSRVVWLVSWVPFMNVFGTSAVAGCPTRVSGSQCVHVFN